MPRAKQEIALSFKISDAISAKLKEECGIENRSTSDMAKIILAEGLLYRETKRNINKIL